MTIRFDIAASEPEARRSRARLAVLLALGLVLSAATAAHAAPGDLDRTFSGDGRQVTDFSGRSDAGRDAVRQPDGRIVVAGGSSGRFAIARYRPDGSLDASFSGDGRQTVDFGAGSDEANGVALQPDGKIVVAGAVTAGGRAAFGVARLNRDGSPDTSFSGDGRTPVRVGDGSVGDDVAVDREGRIVMAGYAYGPGSFATYAAVARFKTNGSLDKTFSADGKVLTDFGSNESYANGIAVQPDGRLVLVGQTTRPGLEGEAYDFGAARLTSAGELDPTFAGDGRQATSVSDGNSGASDLALQADGRIVAAGSGNSEGGRSDFALVRYTARGALDRSFSGDGRQVTSFGGNESARGVALAPDGKIVAAGSIGRSARGTVFDFALARYNANGSLDTGFSGDGRVTTDFGGDDVGASVLLPASGRILVAGSAMRSSTDFALARYRG